MSPLPLSEHVAAVRDNSNHSNNGSNSSNISAVAIESQLINKINSRANFDVHVKFVSHFFATFFMRHLAFSTCSPFSIMLFQFNLIRL